MIICDENMSCKCLLCERARLIMRFAQTCNPKDGQAMIDHYEKHGRLNDVFKTKAKSIYRIIKERSK